MPLPPAHMLLGAAAAEAVTVGTTIPRYRAWAVGAAVALLPDADFAFRLATGNYAPVDRSVTHSLVVLAVVAGFAWALAGRRWGGVAGAAFGSHLVADLLQHQARTSVAPFWPLQQEGMAPLLPLFPYVPVIRGQGGREAALALFQDPSFPPLLQETAIALGIFFGVLLLTGRARRVHGTPAPPASTAPASTPGSTDAPR
jgi:membrane-bound metal-dependent hydrolase YbcI (DUF457 family)